MEGLRKLLRFYKTEPKNQPTIENRLTATPNGVQKISERSFEKKLFR